MVFLSDAPFCALLQYDSDPSLFFIENDDVVKLRISNIRILIGGKIFYTPTSAGEYHTS